MSNCIENTQRGFRTQRMIEDEMERKRQKHDCCLINAETKKEMVEKYKNDGDTFENAFKRIDEDYA